MINKWSYIQSQLKQPSTWQAVSVLAGYMGYKVDADWLMTGATAALLIIGIFWKQDTQSKE